MMETSENPGWVSGVSVRKAGYFMDPDRRSAKSLKK
jgi:hypothetical protein